MSTRGIHPANRKDCGHVRPEWGKCPECKRIRNLDYWNRKGKEMLAKRIERKKGEARELADRQRRAHEAVERRNAPVIALYRAERSRAERQGKCVLAAPVVSAGGTR